MDRSRRDVLRLAGLAGLAAVGAGCTSSAAPARSSSAPLTSSGLPSSTVPVSNPPSSASSSARVTLASLEQQLGDRLARPGQSSYKPKALLYNPRFGNQAPPAAIAYCAQPSDVLACVRFAADGGAPLRLRNGGHSYGGWSSGPGLVADLAALKSVRVDHGAMTATVGAGALLENVYAALAAQGVSIGAGSCATVGITGLTLGGGVGLLTRRYGLTCDQLVSAQVVTAAGSVQTVSADEHPDLFWALRGGGGSFAAVTSLTFRVRPAPRVQQVYLEWAASHAADVLAAWQAWSPSTPRELWSTCKILARLGQGARATVFAVWTGSGSLDAQVQRLLRATPAPRVNAPSSDTYRAAMLGAAGCDGTAQACITAALTPAQRLPEAAASSILSKPLPQQGIDAIVDAAQAGLDVPGMVEGGVSFDALGGAVSDVAASGSAFPWRTAIADIQYTATWPFDRATSTTPYDRFVAQERSALLPFVGSSGYVNYADPSLTDYATAYWGGNLTRLQQVKQTYDPHNVFSFPQAVPL